MDLSRTGAAQERAKRSGFRHTQYLPSGETYSGEWNADKRHGGFLLPHLYFDDPLHKFIIPFIIFVLGKGTFTNKDGLVYEGDWHHNFREGFGVLSKRVGTSNLKIYSGTWKNDKKHVRFCIEVHTLGLALEHV